MTFRELYLARVLDWSVQFYTVNIFRVLSYIKGRHWHAVCVCVPQIQLLK
jgi:hypothetical protein